MNSVLVLVHGRSQQGKVADELKDEWISALRRGLDLAGLDLPIPTSQIRLPYYGNTLRDMVKGSVSVADIIVRGQGTDEARDALLREIVEEIRDQAGITDAEIAAEAEPDVLERGPQDWTWVRAVLRRLDRRAATSSRTVELFTNDVYKYLNSVRIREKIDIGVREALTTGTPTVVVGHSLGSVIAYNILGRDGRKIGWDVPLFVTVGSPLAITAVRRRLTAIEHPPCVGAWYNARDQRDVVALHELDSAHFGVTPAIENYSQVVNETPNRHGITGYLSDPAVARRIHQALVLANNGGPQPGGHRRPPPSSGPT